MNSVASVFIAVLGRAIPNVIPPVTVVLSIFHVLKLMPVKESL